MTKTEMIIKELSTNVFMNSIRLTKPAGQKSQSLQDWRKESVPKLTKAFKKIAEVIMWKLHRATLEVIYKDMGWVKGHIDKLKDVLRSLKIDRDMVILPPYNVEGNMREAPVRSLFYSILTTVEHFTGQKNLSKEDKPVTVWPLSKSAAPEFSLELSGHTFVKGQFLSAGTLLLTMERSFSIEGKEISAASAMEDYQVRYSAPWALSVNIVPRTAAGLQPAPKRGGEEDKGNGKGLGAGECNAGLG